MLIVASDAHREHHCLELSRAGIVRSTEGPDRADIIDGALRAAGHCVIEPDVLDRSLLERVHRPEYVELVEMAWSRWRRRDDPGPAAMSFTWPARGLYARRPTDLVGQLGYHSFAADTSIVAGTWTAAASAVACAVTTADRLLDGVDGDATYALCRPPGHHATADQFGGYCYFNNAALAAQRLVDRGTRRVAVLDVDYHHGNGTQSIFYARDDVLFVSLHADPIFEFPWFAGHADEVGEASGEGWNLNLPLAHGTTVEGYIDALAIGLGRISSAGVEALVLSFGADTYSGDPLGTFAIETDGFTTIAARIAALGLPTVIVQEGGYAVADLGRNVAACLAGFEGAGVTTRSVGCPPS